MHPIARTIRSLWLSFYATGLLILVSPTAIAGQFRIWVDVRGQFSVEAVVVSMDDDRVVLRRKDGGDVTVAIDQLSEEDKTYLEQHRKRLTSIENPLRGGPPERPIHEPLPILALPDADPTAVKDGPLVLSRAAVTTTTNQPPSSLAADPSPDSLTIDDTRIQIYDVDVYDNCSRPIAVTTSQADGDKRISIAMSISRGTGTSIIQAKNQLVRFDLQQQQGFVSLNHNESIRLIDHHASSNRSLVHSGYDSLGNGGYLAIATGWGPSGIQLSHIRGIGRPSRDVRSTQSSLSWAKWVDDEHVVAVIEESLGLWNLVSGEQIYQIDNIDRRVTPTISGGRRYLAVPEKGGVVLYESSTGKSLGRIATKAGNIPHVEFSPQSDQLAITTTRRVACWDLTTAEMTDDIVCKTMLGSDQPIWVDDDLILTSAGILVSLYRDAPIWRYDISTAEVNAIGNHVVVFRKQQISELVSARLPHPGAQRAMEWIDQFEPETNVDQWRLLGSSKWQNGDWVDQDVRVSTIPKRRR